MIVTGMSADEFVQAIGELGRETYSNNLRAVIGTVYSDNRFTARIVPVSSGANGFYVVGDGYHQGKEGLSAPGARRSWSGRRIQAACWHAYRDGIRAVFDRNPDARVYTGMAKYIGVQGFEDNYPATANRNIGSMIQPAYMPDLCDCELYGIDVSE